MNDNHKTGAIPKKFFNKNIRVTKKQTNLMNRKGVAADRSMKAFIIGFVKKFQEFTAYM